MSFSVLMSVYHRENPEHFDFALESNLINQLLPPDEFVLVCDGPLGAQLDSVIEKYQKLFPEVLKVYRLKENLGLGRALNFGLEKCGNDLVARADSDDISLPDRYKKQIAFMEKQGDVALLGTDIEEFEDDPENPTRRKQMPATDDEIKSFMKFRNPINHMTAVFRKSAVEKAGSYIHIPYLEDYYLWVRMAAAGFKAANIGEPLVLARIGNGMVKRRGNKDYIAGWQELSRYMLKNKMITRPEYLRNIIAVRAFVYMPTSIRNFSYKKLLRKGSKV